MRWLVQLHFFLDNSKNNLKYVFCCKDKSEISFETVQSLLLFVYIYNNNKMLWFCYD